MVTDGHKVKSDPDFKEDLSTSNQINNEPDEDFVKNNNAFFDQLNSGDGNSDSQYVQGQCLRKSTKKKVSFLAKISNFKVP